MQGTCNPAALPAADGSRLVGGTGVGYRREMDETAIRAGLAGAGILAVLAGAGGYLRWVALRRRPPLQRPVLLWRPVARAIGPSLALLTTTGLLLLALGAPALALAAAAVLAAALGLRLWRARPGAWRRRVSAALAEHERRTAELPPAAQRRGFLAARRPEWGEDLTAQLVDDWPARDHFVRFVAELERRLGH